MIQITTVPCGGAEILETTEDMAAYLDAYIQISEGDAACITKASGVIVRANGIALIARERGLSHQRLYEGQSGDRSSNFDTMSNVFLVLGL
jgi:probable addiction module antidote protein